MVKLEHLGTIKDDIESYKENNEKAFQHYFETKQLNGKVLNKRMNEVVNEFIKGNNINEDYDIILYYNYISTSMHDQGYGTIRIYDIENLDYAGYLSSDYHTRVRLDFIKKNDSEEYYPYTFKGISLLIK
jgi:hypothetical protein